MQGVSVVLVAVASLLALSSSLAGCGSPTPTAAPTAAPTTCSQASTVCASTAAPTPAPESSDSDIVLEDSFVLEKSPSGLFYDSSTTLLHILCGTETNGDHYLYTYTTAGEQKCLITIPSSVGMSRVDGFFIDGTDAYIVDSQGPLWAIDGSVEGVLGGSLYKVDWSSHPCGCDSTGECADTTASWSPTITTSWAIDATESSICDGAGYDDYFRNSGILVMGNYWYGVNGVHPISPTGSSGYADTSLTISYPKSLIKVDMTTATVTADGYVTAEQTWPFCGDTFGRDIDLEAMTCGSDACADYLYMGCEWNWIYKMDFTAATPTKMYEWDLREIANVTEDDGSWRGDQGIEALTWDGTYFYAGIQGTATVHKLTLSETTASKVIV